MCADLINCPTCDALVFTKENVGRCNLCATVFVVIGDKSLKVEHVRAMQELFLNWVCTMMKLTRTQGG